MSDNGIPNVLLDDQIRESLINYYKWMVSLAVLIVTVSVTLIGLIGQNIHYRILMLLGWGLLVVCIFFNWILIKCLVTLPIVMGTESSDRNLPQKNFIATFAQSKIYGIIQSLSFLLGSGLVFLGLALNWLCN